MTIARAEWTQPRQVDNGRQWWMQLRDIEGVSTVTGEPIVTREGTVTWNADGSGHFGVFISFEREGVGLHCWPDFRALADAQDFVEHVMNMTLKEASALDGTQWPGVVL